MTWSLRAQPEAVGVLSSRVEQALGIPAAHAEKDFWVTEALRAATDGARDEDVTLVFKGGTSLSKAHHLIRRFSEDVDLIVVVPAAKKAADQCLKRITYVVGEALGVEGQVDPSTASSRYGCSHLRDGARFGSTRRVGRVGRVVPNHARASIEPTTGPDHEQETPHASHLVGQVGSDDCLELWAGDQVVPHQADAPAQSRSIGNAMTRSSSP